ncbi:hypothetical protein, partial, partial [Absidia glauca]
MEWLHGIRRLIRRYVLPFFPHPSWTRVCAPKQQGGLGLIDPEEQALALHNTHICSLLEQKNDSPLSPVILKLLQLYTGHKSLVPFMLAPQNFKNLLKPIPHLQQLVLLMKRLPPMPISDTWTPAITQHLPLDKAVLIDIENTAEVHIPRHLTVASILNHHPPTDVFHPKRMDKEKLITPANASHFGRKRGLAANTVVDDPSLLFDSDD